MTAADLAALCAAAFAVMFARLIVPPRRLLAARVRPYTMISRSRLGTGMTDVPIAFLAGSAESGAVGQVLGPLLGRVAEALGSIIDAADHDTLRRRLRNAGFSDTDPAQYRIRQLGHTAVGVGSGLGMGLVLGSVTAALVFMTCFGIFGATLQRSRLTSATEKRIARMRTEVYTVAQLIAVRLRTGSGPLDAVRSVARSVGGPVCDELSEAVAWISSGTPAQAAYDRLAEATDEPSAARLYRLLAASAGTGGDISGSLLSVAEDIRLERKQDLARKAVKRRTAMLVPLLVFITPVMILFVAAALSSLVFGVGG